MKAGTLTPDYFLVRKSILILIISIFILSFISGCSKSSAPEYEVGDDPPYLEIDKDVLTMPQDLTDDLKTISEFSNVLTYDEYAAYMTLDHNKDLRCSLPVSESYIDIVLKLGGFARPHDVKIEKDATIPELYDGFPGRYSYVEVDGVDSEDATLSSSNDVSIERPDRVGRSGDMIFYLSDAYGLVIADIDSNGATDGTVRCAMPLPGRPKSFLIKDDTIIVLINSRRGLGAGMIQFTITGDGLEYNSSYYLADQTILDARLFNNILTAFTSHYMMLPSPAESDALYYGGVSNHQLMVFNTQPGLELTNTEVFNDTDIGRPGDEYQLYSYYNNFLSASGDYLIVTESQTERTFSHNETRTYSVCTNYETREYTYCSTNWKRVLNPDYEPPSASGIFNCGGSLLECLRALGPRVSKYIYVPDGNTCNTYESSYCTAYEYKSHTYPVYNTSYYTKVIVFRFKDGAFVKLNDNLAVVNDGNIETTEDPFRIEGRITKHSQMKFNDDILYSVAYSKASSSLLLDTFTIQGNSAIHVSKLSMSCKDYPDVNCNFTGSRIYISDASYTNSTYQWSSLHTVNIDDPVNPILDNETTIPTSLDQLLFGANALVGIGKSQIKDVLNYYFGTITCFSAFGEELNSFVLGTDYRYFSYEVGYDDQVLSFDSSLNRLFLPYTNSTPFDPDMPYGVNRLTLTDIEDGDIEEEQTFSLPQRPDRSLSIQENLAYAFSNNFIHELHKDDGWDKKMIFNGEVPSSIYMCRSLPLLVKKFERIDQYIFALTSSQSPSSKDYIDVLEVNKSSSKYCTGERVYFDNDRILIVSEPPGVYYSYQDCARDGTDLKVLKGYRITENGFEAIEDEDELIALYTLIIMDIHCVTNIVNYEGEPIYDFDEIPEGSVCYTADEFYEIVSELYNQ